MPDTSLDILIRAILDAKGFEDLKARLQEAATGAQQAKEGTSEFSGAIEGMAEKLAIGAGAALSAAAAIAFLKDSFTAFVQGERLITQYEAANEVLGGQLGKNTAANKEWLISLELQSGLLKEDLIPSYIRFVAVSQDVSEAQRLTQIAANAAKAGLGDVTLITQALLKYWETGVFTLRGGGAALKALAGDAKDTATGVANLEKNVKDLADRIDNTALRIAQARVRWTETKEAVGELGKTFVEYLVPALKVVSEVIAGLNIFTQEVIGRFKSLAFAGGQIFKALSLAIQGDFKGAMAAVTGIADGADRIMTIARLNAAAFTLQIDQIWSDAKARLNEEGGPLHPPPQAGKELKALTEKYEILAKNAVKWGMDATEAHLAVLKVYLQMANDPAVAKFPKLQAEANERLVQTVNALGHAVASERALEVEWSKKLEKQNDEAAKKWLEAETKRIAQFRKDRDLEVKERIDAYKLEHQQDGEYTVQYLAFLQSQLAGFAGTETEKRNLMRETSRIRVGLLMAERAAANAAANEAVTQLGELFGIQKEVSIANALINTYLGATRALADYAYPYSLIVAALTIVAGLAQVANIEKTGSASGSFTAFGQSSGGGGSFGFDNPENDFAAVVGGRKWARDMVDHYSQGAAAGFSEGVRAGGGGSSVSNVTNRGGDRSIHITIQGGVLGNDDASARVFAKRLLPYLNRLDSQRTIR